MSYGGGSSSVIETNDWLYDMGIAVHSPYITTDPNSDLQLEKGERYFMDFDTANIPNDMVGTMSAEDIKNRFIAEMRDDGHDPGNVVVSFPAINIIRITFTANPVIHLIIIVALAAAIILLAAGAGAGLYVAFLGIAKAIMKLVETPGILVKDVIKSPIAVIAIIAAIGIFVVGIKL